MEMMGPQIHAKLDLRESVYEADVLFFFAFAEVHSYNACSFGIVQ